MTAEEAVRVEEAVTAEDAVRLERAVKEKTAPFISRACNRCKRAELVEEMQGRAVP